MTHFLGRLVERARGTAPRVEPIIAPRFAPTPSAETATEVEPAPIAGIVTATESAPPARREARAPEATKPAGRASVRQEKVEAQDPAEESVERSVERGRETLLVPMEIAEVRPPLVVRQEETASRSIPVSRNGAVREAPRLRPRAEQPGSPTPATAPPRARRGIERAGTWPNDQPAEPPIVRVTIGRIEVHAAPLPAPAPRKPSRAAGPNLTLDAYLKSRKAGAR